MWDLLALSLLLLRFNKVCSLIVLTIAVVMGCSVGVLDWTALGWIVATGIIVAVHCQVKPRSTPRVITEILLVADAVILFLHWVPGFHNLRVLNGVQVSPDSTPFTLYYNFDKALIPFLLLGCVPSLFVAPRASCVRWRWILLIIAVPSLLWLATRVGGLRAEYHVPDWLPEFILANIFFVSLAEEALFRGYLQQRLAEVAHPVTALLVSAVIFGAAHYAGGIMLVIFATLAGVIYGIAWMWSGRLWVAVLFHFGLNLTQLFFFT